MLHVLHHVTAAPCCMCGWSLCFGQPVLCCSALAPTCSAVAGASAAQLHQRCDVTHMCVWHWADQITAVFLSAVWLLADVRRRLDAWHSSDLGAPPYVSAPTICFLMQRQRQRVAWCSAGWEAAHVHLYAHARSGWRCMLPPRFVLFRCGIYVYAHSQPASRADVSCWHWLEAPASHAYPFWFYGGGDTGQSSFVLHW